MTTARESIAPAAPIVARIQTHLKSASVSSDRPQEEMSSHKEKFQPSGRLMWAVATGIFEEQAFHPESLTTPLTEVAEISYKALEAQHNKTRSNDSALRQSAVDQYLLEREIPINEVLPEMRHHVEMFLWSGKEAQTIAEMITHGNGETIATLKKLQFNIPDDVDPHTFHDLLQDALYNPDSGEYGPFYKKYCSWGVAMNEQLAHDLTPEQMEIVKPMLVDILGGETAFQALKTLRYTQDTLIATKDSQVKQVEKYTSEPNLRPEEQDIFTYFKEGAKVIKEHFEERQQPRQSVGRIQPPAPTEVPDAPYSLLPEDLRLTPEQQKKIDEAKQEIFDKAENHERNEADVRKLIQETTEAVTKRETDGHGMIKGTIQETMAEVRRLGKAESIIQDQYIVAIQSRDADITVLGDIHGDFAAMKRAIEKSGFIENMETGNKSAVLVLDGDLIDRGRKQTETMEAILALQKRYPNNVIVMKADHEVDRGISDHDFKARIAGRYPGYQQQAKQMFITANRLIESQLKNSTSPTNSDSIVLYDSHTTVSKKDLEKYLTLKLGNVLQIRMAGDTTPPIFTPEQKREIDRMYYGIQDRIINSIDNDLYARYMDFFDKLPRMTVCENGLVVTHGGIPPHLYKLDQLKQNPQILDASVTWADVLNNRQDQTVYEAEKQGVINQLEQSLATQNAKITYGGKQYDRPIVENALETLRQPGIYFDARRSSGSRNYLDLALQGVHIVYAIEALENYLGVIGGKVLVRGHETPTDIGGPLQLEGKVATLHTAGAGPDTDQTRLYEPHPVAFRTNLATPIERITEQNLFEVWS